LHDGFDAQDPFAVGIDLQGELAEMDFEHREIIRRFLDQDSPARRLALPFPIAGTLLRAQQSLDLIQAEGPAVAVDERLELARSSTSLAPSLGLRSTILTSRARGSRPTQLLNRCPRRSVALAADHNDLVRSPSTREWTR
jgi:hypothetical protein